MATDTHGNSNSTRWQSSRLLILADTWLQRLRVRKQSASEHSHWWDFIFRWRREKMSYCQDFMAGVYRFSPMQSSQNDLNQIQVTAEIHDRSCRRALERVRVMKEDAVNSANIQRYLRRWATWWARTIGLYVPADL